MKHIYLDFDDVLCDTITGIRTLAHEQFGRDVAYEDILDFNLQVTFTLSDEELWTLTGMTHTPTFLMSLDPIPGALETLDTWLTTGHRCTVVTGRPPSSGNASEKWLDGHGFGHVPVLHWDKYHRYQGRGALGDADLLKEGFDFGVDDSPLALDRITALFPHLPVAIMGKPWNQTYSPSAMMRRCSDWQAIKTYFEDLNHG